MRRAASNDAYAWREMGKFTLQAQVPSRNMWKDYSVEQGVTYVYAIQQYNNYGLRSDKIKTQPVVVDFEDAFLYDGTRQLKIKYNPKVSSFTREIKEQETETIGSKYPFIFRNGNVDYHRFPISGLISYLGDENQQFMKKKELGIENSTTDLISENILAERLFKTEVLKWLTNGEPKLFRSPGEGNFVVRLLKVSLSPNDTVGRMLHSFSCQATEISNNSYESLKGMGFIDVGSDVAQTRYQSINISGHSQEMDMIAKSIMINRGKVELTVTRSPCIFCQRELNSVNLCNRNIKVRSVDSNENQIDEKLIKDFDDYAEEILNQNKYSV